MGDIFDTITTSKSFGEGHYLGLGTYVLEVKRIFENQGFEKGAAIILEATIVESSNSEYAVGDPASFYQGMGNEKQRQVGGRVLRAMIAAVFGHDPAMVEGRPNEWSKYAQLLRMSCGEENPAAGKQVAVRVVPNPKYPARPTHIWSPVAVSVSA